jgi:hypothetical protein
MSSAKRVGVLVLFVLGWMWIVRLPDGSALAEVKDETGMFSSSAISQADQATRQMKQKYGKEMLVEVFPEIPSDLRSQYSADRKDQFFAAWMTRRAQELKVDGVYVLICRNPNHLQVDAGKDTKQRAFTPQNVEQLKNILVTRFRNKQFDDGLLEAVSYVDRTLASTLGSNAAAGAAAGTANPQYNYQSPGAPRATPTRPPTGSGMSWIWWVLLIGVGIFIISRFLRSRAPGSRTYTQQYPGGNYPSGGGYSQGGYPSQQGGGFGKGIMGGLLGGMAGGWLYDKMGHRNQSSGYMPPQDQSGFSGPSSGDDAGQGFSGGSGGDFGGGDSGGGSGGDFGGGGDAGGGGGGGDGGSGGDF